MCGEHLQVELAAAPALSGGPEHDYEVSLLLLLLKTCCRHHEPLTILTLALGLSLGASE